MLAGLALLLIAACRFEDGTVYRCAPDGTCEPGHRCEGGYCLPEPGEDSGTPGDDGGEDAGELDGGEDAGEPDGGVVDGVDAGAPVGVPVTWVMLHALTELNSSASDKSPTVTADQRTLCFQSNREGTYDLFCTRRPDRDAGFDEPKKQTLSDGAEEDQHPELSHDGTELYFSVSGMEDNEDLFRSLVESEDFKTSEPVTDLEGPWYDLAPSLGEDSLTVVFQSDRTNNSAADLWMASRQDRDSSWGAPILLADVSSDDGDFDPALSPDGGYLLFTSNRDAGVLPGTGPIIYKSLRLPDGGFGPPQALRLEGLTTTEVGGLELAPDDTLYFSSRGNPGNWDLYVARPVYDAGP